MSKMDSLTNFYKETVEGLNGGETETELVYKFLKIFLFYYSHVLLCIII